MNRLLAMVFFLGWVPSLHADWDYEYLPLDGLMARSSLIAVAEIQAIGESIKEGRVKQEIVFTPVTMLKGKADPKGLAYHASYVPDLCAPPEGHYLDSPPGTKVLLFLTRKNDSYVSVLGPCGALVVNDYLTGRVLWYTDESKAQRFPDEWKEKPLAEVIARVSALVASMRIPVEERKGLVTVTEAQAGLVAAVKELSKGLTVQEVKQHLGDPKQESPELLFYHLTEDANGGHFVNASLKFEGGRLASAQIDGGHVTLERNTAE